MYSILYIRLCSSMYAEVCFLFYRVWLRVQIFGCVTGAPWSELGGTILVLKKVDLDLGGYSKDLGLILPALRDLSPTITMGSVGFWWSERLWGRGAGPFRNLSLLSAFYRFWKAFQSRNLKLLFKGLSKRLFKACERSLKHLKGVAKTSQL